MNIIKKLVKSYLPWIIIITVICLGLSIIMFGEDNNFEELIEETIKIQTKENIDLTPNSPEKHSGNLDVLKHRMYR